MTDDQDSSFAVMRTVRHELAAKGVTFERSYVTTPECCPSRATYLTGQYAHNHGVLSRFPPRGGFEALDSSNTLPVWLSRAGYRTAHIGKYLNGYGIPSDGSNPHEVPPGWDDWHVPVKHTEYQMYGYTLNENGRLHKYGDRPRDYQTDVFARKAARYVRRAPRSQPFFLSLAPVAPHSEGVLPATGVARNPRPAPRDLGALSGTPVPHPPSFMRVWPHAPPVIRREELRKRGVGDLSPSALRARYLGREESLLAVDDMVARLLRALRKTHRLGNTYVLFTSDNGLLLGEHALTGKHLAYEESARVPLILTGPGIPAGRVVRAPVANIDLAPTIADIANATPGLDQDGTSLLPTARGKPARRRDLEIEYLVGNAAYAAIVTKRYKLIEYRHGGTELFDLRRDPYELHDLSRDPAKAQLRTRLDRRLAQLKHCAGASCR